MADGATISANVISGNLVAGGSSEGANITSNVSSSGGAISNVILGSNISSDNVDGSTVQVNVTEGTSVSYSMATGGRGAAGEQGDPGPTGADGADGATGPTGPEGPGTTYNTNNYSSISPPQLFNPDASGVSGNTDDFTVESSNDIAFVTLNGQTLDDSEYSLVGATITVTPDVGFFDTADEVLVFQHVFDVSTDGVILGITTKTANYTATGSDYTILCDATGGAFTITLPAVASSSGKVLNIKKIDSSSNTVTADGNASETIDDALTAIILFQYDSLQLQCNGTEWFIL